MWKLEFNLLKISCLEGRGRQDWIKAHKFEIIAAGEKNNYYSRNPRRFKMWNTHNLKWNTANANLELATGCNRRKRGKDYPPTNIESKEFELSTNHIMNVLYTTVWSFWYGSAELHFCFIVINTEIQTTDREDIRKGISEPKHVYPHLYSWSEAANAKCQDRGLWKGKIRS